MRGTRVYAGPYVDEIQFWRMQDDIITLKLSLTKLRVESRLLAGKLAKLITSDQPWSVHPSGTLNDHYLNELLLHSSRESHAIPYREDDDLNAASVPHDPNINHSITIMGCRDDASQLQKLRQENSLLKYALESLKRENQEMGARLVEMAFSSGAGAVINERGSQNWQQVESHDPISALSGSLHGIEGEELASSSSSVGCAGSSSPIPEGPMTPLQLRDIESLKISNNLEE